MQRSPYTKLFVPEAVEHELVMAGLFLAAYELLRSSIIDQPRRFFTHAPGSPSQIAEGEASYRAEVLSLHQSRLMASVLWHVKIGALDDTDRLTLETFREHRNLLAHELPRFLVDDRHTVQVDLISSVQLLVAKVDRWWILNVHVPTDPSFDGHTPPPEDVSSGTMVLLQYLVDTVSRFRGLPGPAH